MRALYLCLGLLVIGCGSSDEDGDGFAADVDCDDSNAAVHPDADERCNAIDDNCDAEIDNDPIDGVTWIADEDGDGFGGAYAACAMPTGVTIVQRGGDCLDSNAMVFPGSRALEVPGDGIDTDCDGNDVCTDLNCDGMPDVVVPSHHDGDYAVTQPARLLSGLGGWGLDSVPTPMSGTLGVAVGDLNNDGYPDIVHASYHDGTSVNTDSFVYWGPKHAPAMRAGLPTHGAHWACIGDLDDNGYADIVFANHTDGATNDTESYIYWNRAGAFSPTDRVALITRGATHCSIDDLNDDGRKDIVFSNFASGGSYALDSYVYWGHVDGYSPAHRTDLPTMGTYAHTIADVNSDGRKDLVFWSHRDADDHLTAANYIYWNRPEGGATGFRPSDRTAFESMGGVRGEIADVNGDGFNEIIAPGFYAGAWTTVASSYVYWGNAQSAFSAMNRTTLMMTGARTAIVDDINNDTYKDLLFTAHYDGDSFAPSMIFWGTAGGTFNNTNRLELPGYHVTNGAGVVDFNHDGFKDIFLPGYHNNATGADATPWANESFSRIYWGSATGLSATFFDEWPTRGAWSAAIVGR